MKSRYKEDFFYNERGETLEQAAHRDGGYFIHGSLDKQLKIVLQSKAFREKKALIKTCWVLKHRTALEKFTSEN